MIFILITFFVASTLLSGCKFTRAKMATKAQTSMVGMSKEDVLSCMGAPEGKASEGETTVWTYMSGDGSTNISLWRGFASSKTHSCKVDVIMRSGRVTSINYSGSTGGLFSEGEQCAYAVENCSR
jgi:outer membrane protein assembly factor BamE (lipoprotein component of BamABCDE complex)